MNTQSDYEAALIAADAAHYAVLDAALRTYNAARDAADSAHADACTTARRTKNAAANGETI